MIGSQEWHNGVPSVGFIYKENLKIDDEATYLNLKFPLFFVGMGTSDI